MTLDPATGVWSTGIGKSANQRLVKCEPPGTSSGLGSFRRWRLKRKSKATAAVNVEKPTLMMRYTGEEACPQAGAAAHIEHDEAAND